MLYRFSASVLFATASLALASGCEQGPLEPTYENVAEIFDTSCSFSSCHGGDRSGEAMLNFAAAHDAGVLYTDLLIDMPSCEYDAMPLVDRGNPDNSWLYVKIVHAHDADGYLTFTPATDWDPGITPDPVTGLYGRSTCPRVERGMLTFGQIMPDGSGDGLDERRATAIREWILAGAPGPVTR